MRKVLAVLAVLAVCAPVCAGVWTEVDLPINRKLRTLTPVFGITAHPRVAGLVFASSYVDTFRSSDWGFHWKRVEGLAVGFDFSFAFNPFDDREIWSGGQYISRNLGASFSLSGNAPGLFDPRIPNRAYRLGAIHLFDRSDDDGRSWSGVGPTYPLGPPFNLSHFVIGAVAIDSNSTLYISGAVHGGFCPFNCTTYRSHDAGVTWEVAFTNRFWKLAGSTLFAFVPDAMNYISVETITTYASVDGGTTWERRGLLDTATNYGDIGGFGGFPVAIDPGGSTILIGLTTIHGGQLHRSDDGGRTWSRIDNGEFQDSHQNRPYNGVESVAIGADGTVYVGTEHRLFTNKVDDRRRRPVVH